MTVVKRPGRGISRRAFLKASSAAGLGVVASPAIVGSALSSSGEMTYMGWSGYDFGKLFDDFNRKTGIRVNFLEQPDQDSMFAQGKLAAASGGIDMVELTIDRIADWTGSDLLQPWDETRIGLEAFDRAFVTDSAVVSGKRYFVPVVWGTEALTFVKADHPEPYGKLGLADLFEDAYAGKVTLRAHSSLAAMGRVLEAQGKLPRPWIDGYRDEAAMRILWDLALAEAVRHKANVAHFWTGENDAQAAFRTQGCTLGLTWDSTGANLADDGFGFVAPREGAIGWLQGYGLMKNATNVEQAQEWVKYVGTPEGSAGYAGAFRANPTAKGAIDRADAGVKAFYQAAYPDDALSRLWWWPPQPAWFLKLRGEYADRWKAA